MQTVLKQLNEVPGVVGSLLCDQDGRVLAQEFPALFDATLLEEAAVALADSAVGLETMTGPLGLLDFRYADARLVVKPIEGFRLLMLCAKNINLQLLLISASVASSKVARMGQETSQVRTPAPAAAPPAREPEDAGKKKPKTPRWTPSL